MTKERSNQELFERKVIKQVLPKYRKAYNIALTDVKHVNTLERLGNLEYYQATVGGYRATAPLTLGSLLNGFNKTVIKTALAKFLGKHDITNGFDFIIDISSSTALYVLTAQDDFDEGEFRDGCRFSANITLETLEDLRVPLVMLRLDDYLAKIFSSVEEFD